MANENFKIESIYIKKFRKLKDINIKIADRLTIVSGHNGIGKSTILGLIANGSEYTEMKSLFDKSFRSKFEEIFHLDEEKDYFSVKDNKYQVILKYKYDGLDLYKLCSISRHKDTKNGQEYHRLKIVPRTIDSNGVSIRQQISDIGPSAKVKIPTLYVGLSRLIPIGESDPNFYETTSTKTVSEDDETYIKSCYSEVLSNEEFIDGIMIKQNLKHSEKKSLGPTFADYPFKSISVGQDSLTTILTALASFNMLARELGSQVYKGGILLIDEIDCGLHPFAQKKLISILNKESKRLNLQIIATTHSLTIIQDVLNMKASTSTKNEFANIHEVVYLTGTKRPKQYENPGYKQIKNDLFILPQNNLKDNKTEISVYLEDREAATLFEYIIQNNEDKLISNIRIKIIDSQIPCDTLIKLPEKDDYFKKIVIVLDGDLRGQGKYKKYFDNYTNILCLPGNDSPERTLHQYIITLLKDTEHQFWTDKFDLISEPRMSLINQEIEKSLNQPIAREKNREKYKKWFNEYIDEFNSAELHKYWIADNTNHINSFIEELNKALLHVSPKLQNILV